MPLPLPRLLALLLAVLMAATACQSSESVGDTTTTAQASSTTDPTTAGSTTTVDPGLPLRDPSEDATYPDINSVEEFNALARVEGVQSAVKFVIPDLSAPGVFWLDSSFYELHDEWYWFQLMNGESVPGLSTVPADVAPASGFQSIDEIYAWASTRRDDLPLDLVFTPDGSRLYSDMFYDLTLRDPNKTYGIGTLVRYDTESGERWVIELQFSEATNVDSIGQFIDRLAETLPQHIGEELAWVPRSPEQAGTAEAMEADGRGDQVVRYADVVPQGEVAVYNAGLTAGRLRLIEDVDDLNRAGPDDILVMETVPDFLPPATAILTSNPQTPLAHVNLLARNRGIPNASVSGLLDDPAIRIAARFRSHAVVSAASSGELEITLISEEQFETWSALREPSPIVVPSIDLGATPTVLSLAALAATIDSEADVAALRPTIGGKSAGFLALIGANGVTTPDSPLAITVAPYFRHLDLVEAELEAMLANSDFQSDVRLRFLLLEGGDEFADVYTSESATAAADAFEDKHPDGLLRTILDADGFMNLFRDADLDEADLFEITSAVETNFAPLSELQGLRFRSSSSIEDIEGFSGAGLYDSNTGYLDPELQEDEGDHKKTVERTIKKTWASYWSFEAYEERRLENVDHRSGGMGVLVHPRFDDALEVDNGVATMMLLPEGNDLRAVVTINVQAGDVSVTNPEAGTDVLPEQILVSISADGGETTIERTGASTLVGEGEMVMDDASVLELVGQLQAVTTLWRDRVNGDLDTEQQVDIVTLDFEFKHMDNGWPAMASDDVRPARLIVKQARSLDPDLRGVPADIVALPIPRDVLARAILVEQVTCEGGATGTEITTSSRAGVEGAGSIAGFFSFSDTPDEIDADCERTTLFSSPEQLLVELLATGEGLDLG